MLLETGIGRHVGQTPKAQEIGEKLDKLDFIKLKTFQITKETVKACIDNLL